MYGVIQQDVKEVKCFYLLVSAHSYIKLEGLSHCVIQD